MKLITIWPSAAGSGAMRRAAAVPGACLLLSGCLGSPEEQLVTIADARNGPARVVDIGPPGDSSGDMVVFDQPLLDAAGDPIGTNSGFCVRTEPGRSYQCQWTLSMAEGSIQVAGHEFDQGESSISILGGTGGFRSIVGEMSSVKTEDGNFLQTLNYRLGPAN